MRATAETQSIGIVGAGPAGLTVAEELRSLGYRHVTVFEALDEAGGKARSLPAAEDHGIVELGTVWYIPGPLYRRYLQKYGVTIRGRHTPPLRILDRSSGEVHSLLARPAGVSRAAWLRALTTLYRAARRVAAPGLPGFFDGQGLAVSSLDWFRRNDLLPALAHVLTLAAGAQFGHRVGATPALYLLKGLGALTRYSPIELLGMRLPQIADGNQELWRRMARSHGVRFGDAVREVRRDGRIRVRTERNRFELDRLIWTTRLDDFARVADATAEERAVFERIRWMKRAVVVQRVHGLPESLFCFVRDGDRAHVPAGHPHIVMSLGGSPGWYAFYPYFEDGVSMEDVGTNIGALVSQLGGRLGERPVEPVVWDWFPHFGGDDISGGIYDRFEALQGNGGVYFAGEIAAGVAVAFATEYAADLVRRFFVVRG